MSFQVELSKEVDFIGFYSDGDLKYDKRIRKFHLKVLVYKPGRLFYPSFQIRPLT